MKLLLGAFLAVTIWFPLLMSSAPALAPTAPIVLPPPPGGVGVHAENTQIHRDRTGVIFACTRANTSIGGVCWRVDGYVDADHPGTARYVLNDPFDADGPEPTKFFGNGELNIYPDGYLWYTTVWVDSIDPRRRNVIAVVSYPVPGWTP